MSVVERLFEVAHHQGFIERFLLRESARVNGLKASQKLSGLHKVVFNRLLRKVRNLIVIPLVTEDRGELWAGFENVFPLFGEQVGQLLAPRFEVCRGIRAGRRK